MAKEEVQLPPGFRFHPTDEELILYYLKNQVTSLPCPASIIEEVDIYKFDPWDLPGMAMFGDKERYFFTPRDRKYPNGTRPNRAAGSGYWKATGTDKVIQTSGLQKESIGVKKALVFYKGRPPRGAKTNWIMNEYRLLDSQTANDVRRQSRHLDSMRLDDWVLCRIYRRPNGGDGSETNKADVMLPRSFSSELLQDSDLSVLSLMFYGNPMEVSTHELGYDAGHPAFNAHEGNERSQKRHRTSADYRGENAGAFHQRKNYQITNQTVESPPRCSLLTQPFLPQNVLLTSNLGFQ